MEYINNNFKNLKELIKNFSDEQKCIDLLVQMRWNGCPICPYCNSDKWYKIEGGKRFKCANKECYKKYSVTVGTPMKASNIPLTTWLPAIYLVTSHKKGISSCQLAKDLGTSQKTAWFMIHRIREMHREKQLFPLKNTVEIDEIYIGAKMKNMSHKQRAAIRKVTESNLSHKSMVIGMIERGGTLKLQQAPNNFKGNITPIVYKNVDKSASLVTDGEATYVGIGQHYTSHNSVNHVAHEYVRGDIHTNTIEGAFGLFRRSIIGIYHKISPKHLSRYCDEFAYRYNTRKLTDGQRFELSLGRIEGSLSWKELIKENGFEAAAIIEPNIPIIESGIQGRKRPIAQMLEGEIIATFPSIIAASRATGIKPVALSKNVRGTRKSSGGYQWKYL